MAVCPKCGSNNFRYELREAETRSHTNYYRTGIKKSWFVPAGRKIYRSRRMQKAVGVCADCGYTEQEKGGLWYLLCVIFFPIALSIWFYKTRIIRLDKKWRLAIIAAFWIAIVIIGIVSPSKVPAHVETETAETAEQSIDESELTVDSVWASEYTPLSDFKYYIDGNEITLTDYKGRAKKVNISPVYEIDGKRYSVVSIDGIFALKDVVSVIIPDGVMGIANNTFNSCGIKYLYLPSTIEKFDGWSYFHDMQKLYYGGSEEQWDELCTRERSRLDVVQIVFNAEIEDLTD